jgi:LacI family transcriptional regulator
MASIRRVGLLRAAQHGTAGDMDIMEGVLEYARTRGLWHLIDVLDAGAARRLKIEGLLVVPASQGPPPLPPVLQNLPAVHLLRRARGMHTPTAVFDETAIGAMAAAHFLERGFRHFVYLDVAHPASRLRLRGYRNALLEAGYTLNLASSECPSVGWGWMRAEAQQALRQWILSLPRPLAAFCFSDHIALNLIHAMVDSGLSVPHDVAVLGVDNALLRCEFSPVPISSIDRGSRRLGQEAAALLDDMLNGRPPRAMTIKVPPAGVEVRQSTDTFAMRDRHLVKALRLIHQEACDGLNVEALLERIPVSRSWLEKHFRKELGHSPHEEIRRVRLRRAEQLIRDTNMDLTEIAIRSGFNSRSYLSRVFSDEMGVSPAAFRRDLQGPQVADGA